MEEFYRCCYWVYYINNNNSHPTSVYDARIEWFYTNIMQKLKQYWVLILIVLIMIVFSFYWFQLRTVNIKKECYKTAEQWSNGGWAFDYHYKQCLRSNGL